MVALDKKRIDYINFKTNNSSNETYIDLTIGYENGLVQLTLSEIQFATLIKEGNNFLKRHTFGNTFTQESEIGV